MKKTILTLFLFSVFLTGCAGSVEIKDKAIIQSIGIDYNEENYNVTMQIFKFNGSEKEKKSEIIFGEGDSLSKAMTNATFKSGKKVFLGNNKMVVIGYDAAKNGIEQIINYFNSEYQSMPKTRVLLAFDKAEDIIKAEDKKGEIVIADKLDGIIERGEENALVPKSTVIAAKTAMENENSSGFLLTMVKTNQSPDGGTEIGIQGAGLFLEDKLVDIFSEKETRGALWISNKIKNTTVSGEYDNQRYSVKINKVEYKIKPNIVGNYPQFDIILKVKGNLQELFKETSIEGDIKEVEKLQEDVKRLIFKEIESAINKAVYTNKADIYYLNHYLLKGNSKWFLQNQENYKDILDKSIFNLDIKVTIEKAGFEDEKQ